MIKAFLKKILGESHLGAIEFARFPDRGTAWGGPFNGQQIRQRLFSELVACVSPTAIVETGTYLGTTTAFMADAGLPVFTIEADRRKYGFARARLWRRHNVKLCWGDSRVILRTLLDGPLKKYN